MKRQERRHLKENELAHGIRTARDFLETRGGLIGRIVGAVAVIAVIALVVVLVRQRSSNQAEQLLGEAMSALNAEVVPSRDPETDDLPKGALDLPAGADINATGSFATEAAKLRAAEPKLRAAADAYPDKPAGVTARYHLAGALAALGRNAEAAKEFAEVVRRGGENNLYGRMAMLGQADNLARAGQIDEAIEAWKRLAARQDSELPRDAILMELGRAYVTKGNTEEARKTLTELVDQHPDSPYSPVARGELENLKG
jgi:TolA-binding protein